MKKKIILLSIIQILFVVGLYFLLTSFISDDSWQSSLIRSAVFGLFYFFLFPKTYSLFSTIKLPKEYRFTADEKLLFETMVFSIGIAFPEKTSLKITNKNIIYRIYSSDKIIPLENVEEISAKKLDLILHYRYGNKPAKMNFITDEIDTILNYLPKLPVKTQI